MNPTGFRVQTLGIQLTGEKQLGFSGAFETDTLWTNPRMHARCAKYQNDRSPDEFSDFEPELHGFQAHHAGWNNNLVRPDTVKKKKREDTAEDLRCRSHLHNAATGKASHCTCGIYSFKTIDDLFEQYHPDRFGHYSRELIMCVTEVMGWGAIAEYRDGWRMQDCRPIGITLVCGTNSQEDTTAIWDEYNKGIVGRFLKPGAMAGVQVKAVLPIHALVSLMSAKFECPVRVTDKADNLLVNPVEQD